MSIRKIKIDENMVALSTNNEISSFWEFNSVVASPEKKKENEKENCA